MTTATPPRTRRWERLLTALELGPETPTQARWPARDRIVDTAMVGFAATAAAATTFNDRLQNGAGQRIAVAIPAAIACAALLARRRAPVGVAVLTTVLSAISPPAIHAAHVALFSAAIRVRPRSAVALTLAGIAATAVACALFTGGSGPPFFNQGFFSYWSATTVAALALGSFVRVRRELVAHLRTEDELRLREARAAERTSIAREMHDVLAHRISLLAIHAGALDYNRAATPEETAEALAVIRATAHTAQDELRDVLGVLRSGDPGAGLAPPQPTLADLPRLLDEARRAGTETTISGPPPHPMPTTLGRTAYRIVQEALTNARTHARGEAVTVTIDGAPGDQLRIEVVNRPAAGHVPRPPQRSGSGTGLAGLTERVALAHGTIEHAPLAGGGFRLAASLPWPVDADEGT